MSEPFGLHTWSLQHVFSFGISNALRFKQHHSHPSSMLELMARVCGQLGTLRCGFLISWRRRSCRVRQVTSKILWRRVPSQRVYSGSTWLQRVYACRPCESDISHAGSQTTFPRGPFCGFATPRLVYTLAWVHLRLAKEVTSFILSSSTNLETFPSHLPRQGLLPRVRPRAPTPEK